MAAAIIPLVAALAPTVIHLVESLVQGEKRGPAKAETVLATVKAFIEKLGASGDVKAALPADEVLAALIESEFQKLKGSGKVDVPAVLPTSTHSELPLMLLRAAVGLLESKG